MFLQNYQEWGKQAHEMFPVDGAEYEPLWHYPCSGIFMSRKSRMDVPPFDKMVESLCPGTGNSFSYRMFVSNDITLEKCYNKS